MIRLDSWEGDLSLALSLLFISWDKSYRTPLPHLREHIYTVTYLEGMLPGGEAWKVRSRHRHSREWGKRGEKGWQRPSRGKAQRSAGWEGCSLVFAARAAERTGVESCAENRSRLSVLSRCSAVDTQVFRRVPCRCSVLRWSGAACLPEFVP